MKNLEDCYIVPEIALKKLRVAKGFSQMVYIYGATGFGKTELVKQYLKNRKYIYFSCDDGIWQEGYLEAEKGEKDIVVIDDLQQLRSDEAKKKILELAMDENVWLILIGRSPSISWIMPIYAKKGIVIIGEEDLKLSEKAIKQYFNMFNLNCSDEYIKYIYETGEGNPYVLQYVVRKMIEGTQPYEVLSGNAEKFYIEFLENFVIVRWDTDLADFLIRISVVDKFTESLAETITGNNRIGLLLEKAKSAGNFIKVSENGVYSLRPVLLKALRNKAEKYYDYETIRQCAYNAGLYYEMHDKIVLALSMYEKSGNNARIRELLTRNARRNPGTGHYFELRKYYLSMNEEEIEKSAVLMSGMSMLYSLLMQEDKSEYWYEKLKDYSNTAKGGEKREALSYLTYLDISLPHRGSINLIEILKKVPILLFDKGIELPEFSVTGNLPSTMNGGKDFCQWSLIDKELASSIGKLVERVFGRYGKGLVKVALAESYYEKGK